MAKITLLESTAPATPSTNYVVFYAKADGKLYAKDDTGAESVITQAPASSTDNGVPRFDGTGGALQTSGVSIDDSNIITASGVAGGQVATQAEQETASSTARIVTPGRQHFHPSAIKAAVRFNSAGTIAYNYNITSITDNGAGSWDIVIATDFSGAANYVGVGMCGFDTADGSPLIVSVRAASAAGTFSISSRDMTTAALRDPDTPDEIHVILTGDFT